MPQRTKSLIILAIGLILCRSVHGQENYIANIKPTSANSIEGAMVTTVYYDDAGREIQTVQKGITPLHKDFANYIDYDAFNCKKQVWDYIPTTQSSGDFIPIESLAEYDNAKYANFHHIDYEYDLSSLRPLISETGKNTAGHSISYFQKYSIPTNVYRYTYIDDLQIKNEGKIINPIYSEKVTDEDGISKQIYKDADGHIILERRYLSASSYYDTYYVYDIYGDLNCVLPPKVSTLMRGVGTTYCYNNRPELEEFGYFYRYDKRGNCIAKKLPGIDWTYTIYDGDNRPVLTQTPNQRLSQEWSFIKYDGLGRVILEGTVVNYESVPSLISIFSNILVKESYNVGQGYCYTNNISLGEDMKIEKIFFYGNYDFLNSSVINTSDMTCPANFNCGRHDLSGIFLTTIDDEAQEELSVYSYDYRGRESKMQRYNSVSGITTDCTTSYNFLNLPVSKSTNYSSTTMTCSVFLSHLYDSSYRESARIYNIQTSVNDVSATTFGVLNTNSYDEFGRIQRLSHFGGNVSTNYTYRDDGKLQSISSPHFSQILRYDDPSITDKAKYSGFVTAIETSQNNVTHDFNLTFDKLGRMTYAVDALNQNTNERFSYDTMGNITSMQQRLQEGTINNVSFEYEGNQLILAHRVTYPRSIVKNKYFSMYYHCPSTDNYYFCDANGNEIVNPSLNVINTKYNHLNLPTRISFSDNNTLEIRYLSDGRKLQSRALTYLTPMVIPNDTLTNIPTSPVPGQGVPILLSSEIKEGNLTIINGIPTQIEMPNGYINILYNENNNSITYQKYFYIKDHLGSVRTTYITSSSDPVQQIEYMPSGAVISNSDEDLQQHLFCGKELVTMHGWNMYDSQARFQYNVLPRFSSIDPLCEKYYSVSPYSYCANNPVNFVDKDGRFIVITDLKNQKYFYNIEKKTFVGSNGDIYDESNQFINDVAEQFSKLCEGEAGNDLVSSVANSEKGVQIYQDEKINIEDAWTNETVCENIVSGIRYSGTSMVEGGTAYTALGHELQHSLDRINDNLDSNTWVNNGNITIKNAEISATFTENKIRSEHKLPLRQFYIQGNNVGTTPTTRIIDKKNRSFFYDKSGNHLKHFRRIKKENRYQF